MIETERQRRIGMIFDMTYNNAMCIQRAQLAYYRQLLGYKGYKYIRNKTLPCPANVHPDMPLDIFTINALVPRGGDIEHYIGSTACTRFRRHRMPSLDPLNGAMHDAIRRGLL